MRTCIFCGQEGESSSCPSCGYIRNQVRDFEKVTPGGNPIEFEAYLRSIECRHVPSLAMLSKIMNEVLRSGSGSRHRPGTECKKIDNGYFGLV